MWAFAARLAELERTGTPAALVTVTKVEGSVPREVGAKMVVRPGRLFDGTIGGGHLEELVLAEAEACIAEGASKTLRYPLGPSAGQCCGGVVELFVDVLHTGPSLILFGAGHVGQAVMRVMVGTAFRVHVVDDRSEWLDAPEVPKAVVRHHGPWDEMVDELTWDAKRTHVAVMTHRHDVDQAIVEHVLRRPHAYLGLIGSRTKWAKFRARLGEKGVTKEALDSVKCPIGLDVGGKAPAEVAVSVAAELLRLHHRGLR
ncbi:MAG: xanthine dehydrogenase accessory protein XdhC [Polyangiaceae bacterium]